MTIYNLKIRLPDVKVTNCQQMIAIFHKTKILTTGLTYIPLCQEMNKVKYNIN